MSAFRFKQFAVEQDDVAMKVGTDGVLLGAWVDVAVASRILDIGTGTGVIALMLAQRSGAESIVGIDIDSVATARANSNFSLSPWSTRLMACNSPVQQFDGEKFDLIVSNPPYFTDSLLCPDSRRTLARHTTELSLIDLDDAVQRLLADAGRFALILPAEQMERYIALSALTVVRRCDVYSYPGGDVKRVMAELSRGAQMATETQNIAIYTEKRDYSAEYRELTKDFYLKF